MKVTVDTNVLVRAVVHDDEGQAEAAATLLREADVVAVPVTCLCEFIWVLRRVYGFRQPDISAALGALLDAGNVAVDRPAVDAGMAVFDAGGDFADGVIAYEGRWLGGDTFASFDRNAVSLLAKHGLEARLLV
ncbi:MAG: type II toxin-antitoxin system VapC family toxin [Acetobacteraceae bacterium]